MITYLNGTVFESPAKTIVNTVNCVGVLGKGIALEFKLRFDGLEEEYKKMCEDKTLRIGRPKIYRYSDHKWIFNFPTKQHWKNPSKIEWIEEGLIYFVSNYKKVNVQSIAFPKLGCGNGGLDWELVKPIMEKYLNNLDIDVFICLNDSNHAEGTEKKMVDEINKSSLNNLIQEAGVSMKQAKIIQQHLPIKRFWQVQNIPNINKKTYETVFRYYYKLLDINNKCTIDKVHHQIDFLNYNDNVISYEEYQKLKNELIMKEEEIVNLKSEISYLKRMLSSYKEKNDIIASEKKDKSTKYDEVTINKILNLREQNMTYDEIANKMNIPRSTVGNLIRKYNK